MEPKQTEIVKKHEEEKKEIKHPLKNGADFIDESFGVYKKHYKTFLSISAVSLVPSILVSVFSEESVYTAVTKTFGLYASIFCGAVMGILFIIISSWSQIALLYSLKEQDKELDPSQAFAFAWHKLISYWWIACLTGFIILGGLMLFFIPGAIFAIWFSFAYYLLIMEDEKGMNALLKSREYVKGHGWAVLWRFIVLYFFNLLFAIPVGILFGGFPAPWSSMLTQNVFSFFVVPFNIVYLFLVYRNLKEVKGEFIFAPHKKTKRVFLVIATVGIILPFVLIGLFALLFPLQASRIFLMMTSM